MNTPPINPLLDDDSAPAVLAEARVKRRNNGPRDSAFVLEGVNEAILTCVDKNMYVNTEQIAALLGVSRKEASDRLNRLHRMGLLGRKNDVGYPLAFFLTQAGKDLVGSDTSPVSETTGSGFVRHAILTGSTMLALIHNRGPVAQQITKAVGMVPALDSFITEAEIARSLAEERAIARAKVERASVASGGYAKALGWQEDELLAKAAIRERRAGNPWRQEWLCTIFGGHQSYHFPDLVLEVPGVEGARPRFVAFEIERSRKPRSVASILTAYYTNMHERPTGIDQTGPADVKQYSIVIWVCADRKVQASVGAIADSVFADSPYRKHVRTYLEKDVRGWMREDAEAARADREKVQAERRDARAKGMVHLLRDGKVRPCNCGEACTAKFGRFPNEVAARDTWDEMR